MKGECIDVTAVQSLYPPILRFKIRLKNDEGFLWHNFSYNGELKLALENVIVGRLEVEFAMFKMEPKAEYEIEPVIELDYRKLDFIEEKRKGDISLYLQLNLLGVGQRGTEEFEKSMARGLRVTAFHVYSPNLTNVVIPQSKWVKILEKLGYGKFKIVELQIPSIPSGVIDDAVASFEKAKSKFNEGDYVQVLINCQDVMDKIGKATKPFRLKLEEYLGKEKFERVNKFKGVFEAFLGLRHEVALEKEQIVRRDGELALQTTVALLNYFVRRLKELKEKP